LQKHLIIFKPKLCINMNNQTYDLTSPNNQTYDLTSPNNQIYNLTSLNNNEPTFELGNINTSDEESSDQL
ncbi:16235_t:CDS:1, partial [Cetraspora pellucida]